MCRKTQPHTRTLGNFPEHLTYQVVSGIRLCNRDTHKRTAGSVGFAVLSEATPTSTLTPSKRSMSSSKIIGALLHAYASIVGVFEFAILPKPSCTRKRCADAHAHALGLSSKLPSLGPHGLSTGTCFRWCGLLMVTGCLFLAEISARHKGEVWCSPTCGSLSRFKCHSDAISALSCLMWTLAAACDAVQVNARMEVFFRDSGRIMLCCKGPFDLDVTRFIRRWAFRSPMQETCVAFQWCVCFTLHEV